MGDYALNEGNNSGYDSTIAVGWHTDDIEISSTGTFQGTIHTAYGGPALDVGLLADVLFMDVQGTYVWEPYGDRTSPDLSGILPFVAAASDSTTATFAINGSFDLPDTIVPGSEILRSLDVNLTWVRVYGTKGAYSFSIYPGRGESTTSFKLDAPSRRIAGAFGYYSILRESELAPPEGGDFDYHGWIVQHVLK